MFTLLMDAFQAPSSRGALRRIEALRPGLVLQLTCGDRQAETVLGWSERTGGEWNVSAGKVDRLVEVEDDDITLGARHNQLPGTAMSRPSAGPVAKHEPKRTVGLA